VNVTLIVNPYATKVTWKARMAAQEALLTEHELTTVETAGRDHAAELARQAAADGAEVVVVLGGDGTVNEAANGLVGTETALAPLPGGSTNVFARTIGLAPKAEAAAWQLRGSLAKGSVRRFRLGTVEAPGREPRHFLFHVGLGFDAAVVAQVERRSHLKRKVGQAVFVWAAFASWFRHYDHDRPRFALAFDDGAEVDDGYFTICLNTNPYTFLGPRPLNVSPDTGPQRGLATVTARDLGIGTLFTLFGSALGTGAKLRAHRNVDYHADLSWLRAKGHGPFPYQVDGDYLGDVEELSFASDRASLRLVVP
jgi:diacylglycerol kinase family enzyme